MWLVRLVALKKAIFLNSVTDLCLTKLDVLDEFDEIKVCVEYSDNQPVYKTLKVGENPPLTKYYRVTKACPRLFKFYRRSKKLHFNSFSWPV